jgi:hypothetical protein
MESFSCERIKKFIEGKSYSVGGYNIIHIKDFIKLYNTLYNTNHITSELSKSKLISIVSIIVFENNFELFCQSYDRSYDKSKSQSQSQNKTQRDLIVDQKPKLKIKNKIIYDDYYIRSIELGGGGDCFYYVTSEILKRNGKNYNVKDLRKIVSETILTMDNDSFELYSAIYEKSREDLAIYMSKSISDADDLQINIIANYFNICYYIYNVNTNKFTCAGISDKSKIEIYGCLYYTGGHYQLGVIYNDTEEIFSVSNKLNEKQILFFDGLKIRNKISLC